MLTRKTRGGAVRLDQAAAPLFGAAHLRGELVLANVDPAAAAAPAPVWIQIARTGKWMGHPAHPQGVEFTRTTFEQVVTNLRADPSYQNGTSPVVPYDYEHASEMDPTLGSVPANGAPAPAWVLDLQIRAAADGQSDELWALTDLGEKARKQIADKEYRWTSVSIWPSARDAVTNQPIGALLTSVALTNHPFIKGLNPMAIAARARQVNASVSVYGAAASPEEAIVGMRDIFGLPPDATVEQISAQFQRLGQILATPQPDGEEDELYDRAEEVACRLRDLLSVPTLSSLDEIIAAGGQILSAMSLLQPSAPTAPGAPTMTTTPAQLTSKLCRVYNLREGATDESILLAAEKTQVDSGALAKLQALFGSPDTQSLLADAQKAIDDAEKSKELVAALTAAQGQLAENDKQTATGEVDAIAASMQLSPAQAERMKPLLLKERMACSGDATKLAAFRAQYPVPTAHQQLLTQPLVAGAHGVQYGSPATAHQVSLTAPAGAGAGGPPPHPLETYSGVNAIEKAMAYLTDKRPGFKTKARIDRVHEAGIYLRQGAPVL